MAKFRWLKSGLSGFLAPGVLTACAEETPIEETVPEEQPAEEEAINKKPVEEEAKEEELTAETAVPEEAVSEKNAAQEGPVELGAIEQTELEKNYLNILGWSPREFNAHIYKEHGKHLSGFAELESTVSPVENIIVPL